MPFLAPLITALTINIAVFTATAPILSGILFRIGGALLLSAAARALMPRVHLDQSRTVTVREAVRPRDIAYGVVRKGGTIVYMTATAPGPAYGSGTSTMHLVVALSQGPVQSIGAVYFDGKLAVDAAGVVQAPWTGQVVLDKRLGAADQTTFAELAAASAGGWTENHRLRGVACLYLQLRFNAQAFPGGVPNVSVDIQGKADILDPRTGLRGFSSNAALCLADYMSLPDFGLGAAIGAEGGITTADLIEAANICDEPVTLAAGGTEPRYTLNGVVTLSDSPKAIIEAMLSAMAGQCLNPDGSWRIRAGAWRSATVTLTTDDARGPIKLSTRQSRGQNFNAVRGQFVSPQNEWQADDFPAVTNPAYLAEDNGERIWEDITLPFTTSASMAQRLAKIRLERQRKQQSVSFPAKLKAWRATVGDVATLTYSRWGFATKTFEVAGLSLSLDGAALVPDLSLRETSATVYAWSPSEEQIYAVAPRANLPTAYDVATPSAPTVTEALYTTVAAAGPKIQATLTWGVNDPAMAASYEVQGSLQGGAWAALGTSLTRTLIVLDIAPGSWVFRVRALSASGIQSAWASAPAEIFGLSPTPAAITGLSLQVSGGLAVLKWDRHPDASVRVGGAIVIRHSAGAWPYWTASVGMGRVAGDQITATVSLKPGTYFLRAEDSGGHLGPAVSLTTDGTGALTFSQVGLLQEDTVFAGAKSGTAVQSAGGLVLTSTVLFSAITLVSAVGSFAWPDLRVRAEGTYGFVSTLDLVTAQHIRLRSVIWHQGQIIADRISRRTGTLRTWASFGGTTGAETDVVVEASTTPDDPASGLAVWSAYARVDAVEATVRGIRGQARLRTTDAAFTPNVTLLQLIAEIAL